MVRRHGVVVASAGLAVLALALVATPLGAGATSIRQTLKASSAKPSLQGPRGPRGFRGKRGRKGIRGPTGLVGPVGRRGASGFDGATGPQGVKGPNGPPGETGPKGPTGAAASDRCGVRLGTIDSTGDAG